MTVINIKSVKVISGIKTSVVKNLDGNGYCRWPLKDGEPQTTKPTKNALKTSG